MNWNIYIILVFTVFLVWLDKSWANLAMRRAHVAFMTHLAAEGPWSDKKFMIYSNITQKVDHFNAGDTRTWVQKYQYNSKFYNKSNPIAFLMIGGESEINDVWVRHETEAMMTWVQDFGAAAFQVEHRFYGDKNHSPIGDQKTSSLQLLTIDQSLADIKDFIDQMNKLYFAGLNPIWITFGGSYPGSLSAWFRETYPEMTIGAVSSSSAVNVQVDYYGYAINTERNYRAVSNYCGDIIGNAFQSMIVSAYNGSETRKQLKEQFNLCDDFDETHLTKSIQFFFSNVYGYLQGINQYSGNNRDATKKEVTIQNACSFLNDTTIGTPVQRLLRVMDLYDKWYPPSASGCRPNSYKAFIDKYSDTTMPDSDVVWTRSWTWQTCTAAGYFQTTDGGDRSIFGSTVFLDFFADQCIDLFGKEYNLDTIFRSVDAVRDKYGGAMNYKGTRVLFPNGSLDPWKDLGHKLSDKNSHIDSWLIEGTAHCADMLPASPSDPPSLTLARQRIRDTLESWLSEARNGTNNISSALFYAIFILSIRFLTL